VKTVKKIGANTPTAPANPGPSPSLHQCTTLDYLASQTEVTCTKSPDKCRSK